MPRRICSLIKLSSCYCEENGTPIMESTKVSKAQFDQFRSSSECMWGVEKFTIPPSPKFNLHRPDIATMPRNVTSSSMVASAPIISLPSSPSAAIPRVFSSALTTPVSKRLLFSESEDDEDSGNKISELQYVFHSIFCEAVDSPLVKALEKHGFTTIQDVLLLNQAERDALQFPKADGTLSTLPIGSKSRLLVMKLFGQYCADEGKSIVN